MTNEDFATRIIAMQGTLYRVTCAILRDHADREDAVQSAIEKAWRKRSMLRDEGRLKAWVVRILINEWNVICQGQIYLKSVPPVELVVCTALKGHFASSILRRGKSANRKSFTGRR